MALPLIEKQHPCLRCINREIYFSDNERPEGIDVIEVTVCMQCIDMKNFYPVKEGINDQCM